MNEIPLRDDVDERYRWDLSTVFESADEWDRERTAVPDRVDDLRDQAEHLDESSETLLRALQLSEEVLRRTQRLRLYARLRRNEDTEDSAHQERLHQSNRLDRDVTKATDMLRREIQAAGRETIERAVETTGGLEGYERFLQDVLRMSTHTRSPEVEDLLADFSDVVESPTRLYTSLTNNDIEPQRVQSPAGDDLEVTAINLGNHLRDRDRAFRRRAYQAVYDEHAAVEHTIGTAYAEKAKAQTAVADARNYGSVREMAFNKPSYPKTGLHVHLPTDVHDTFTAAIRDSLGPHRRYLERRREILGVDELEAWDLDVPLVETDEPTVPYEEARDHVLAAVEPLGEAYQERLAAFLSDRRIDVYETRRKEDILGYVVSSYDTGSYVLLNYQDDAPSMSMLAHELGHAMHVEFLRDSREPVYTTVPRPIEEVPSYVHEILLARHVLDTEEGPLHEYARDRLLDVLQGIYEATFQSVFTHETYSVVEDGADLTIDRIEEIYVDLLSEFRPPVTIDTWAERGWLVGSHGRLPYHYYQYVLGIVGALHTVDRLLDGTLKPEAYHEFLRAGGTVRSVEAFETLGLDIRSREPFERTCAVVEEHVSEMTPD